MENRMEMVAQKLEAAERYMAGKEEECNMLKLDLDTLNEENKRLKENLNDMMLKLQVRWISKKDAKYNVGILKICREKKKFTNEKQFS